MKLIHYRLIEIYRHLLSQQDGRLLIFKTVADICPCCRKHMEGKTCGKRTIITLVGGTATIVEEYFVCPHCKDWKTGRRVIHHSEALRGILPLNTKYGYDVEIEIGYLQYADNRQMDEIGDILDEIYGMTIPQSQIHELGIRFLRHMVVLHYLSAPLLRELFKYGCVYHIDATCEAGRGMELVVKEGWTGIVLGVWNIPTENEEIIGRHLGAVVEVFGEPDAFVSDLGNGMMTAIAGVIQKMGLKSRQLVCHMHFLKAVGKSILEDTFQTLKSQFRKQKSLAHLNRFARETGDIIKPQAAAMRGFVVQWQNNGAQTQTFDFLESVAVLRAFAQWVIQFGAECNGEGFPFALSYTKLFARCTVALFAILSFVDKNCFHERSIKYAKRLQRILEEPVTNPEIQKTVRDLKSAEAVFTELRAVLRLEKTDVYKQEKDKKDPDRLDAIACLKEETSRFRSVLNKRLELGAVTVAQADAIRIVIAYLDHYEPFLFNHFVVSYDKSGNAIVRLIERSNNIMEKTYRDQKHQLRRRTGAKNLGFIFEHLFPASAMIVNLVNPTYQQTVLNNKTRSDLIDLISTLDDRMDYRNTPMFQDEFEMVGGRLPSADKKIVGKPDFSKAISALFNEYINSLCPQLLNA